MKEENIFALEDRLNRVIHTTAFSDVLERSGLMLAEVQCMLGTIRRFKDLPICVKRAVFAGEAELNGGGVVDLSRAEGK